MADESLLSGHPIGENAKQLREGVSSFLSMQRSRHGKNFRMHWSLVILVLLGTALTTVGGIKHWDYDTIALLGVATSVVVAIHTAIAIGDKAEFQRVLASEAENILTLLKDSRLTSTEFDGLRTQFIELRKHADAQLPKGGGMDAVRRLSGPPAA